MNKGSLRLGKIFGIEINLHFTWFFIFLLIAWSLAANYFPREYPGLLNYNYWIFGIMAAILLFVSVLFHEITHSLVARYFKIKVDAITLFFFGGVAQLKEQKFTPKKEFWVALSGPMFSLSLAGVFYLLTLFSANIYVQAIFGYLALLNLILGLFNLVPGFPLDGGRVLRAVLWKRMKDLRRATYIAAETGKAFAIFMIVFGIAGIIFGGFGLWYILLGIFLYGLSKQTYRQTLLKSVLEKVLVKDVMTKKYKSFSPSAIVSNVKLKPLLKYQQDFFPVVKNKKILGIVAYTKIRDNQEKKKLKIKDIMRPIKRVRPLREEEHCYNALKKMMKQKIGVLPVVEKGKIIAVLNGNVLAKLVELEGPKKK